MTEKRFRVFKYPDCKEYGVSDDVAEYTLARFDNHFEAEGLCELLNELHSENEQFKQSQKSILRELLIYRRIASCSNCKYQNYDWFDDGDEFEICEKGNNEQQIAYHICKEWREI